nr:hypothetical protein [Sphingomonas sp. Leaf22]
MKRLDTRSSRVGLDTQGNGNAMRVTADAPSPTAENLMDERQRKAALARPLGNVGPGRNELLSGRNSARRQATVNIGDFVRHVSCISL